MFASSRGQPEQILSYPDLSKKEFTHMTEQATSQAPATANDSVFGIQRTYLKGASLELPRGAETFLQEGAPHIELNVGVSSAQLADGIFEVVLRGTLNSTIDGKTVFLLEVDQAGIFEIRNVPVEHMQGVLEVSCPSILTPYLRAQVADMLARATLPVFHMPEVNWMAMHAQRVAEQPQAANDATLH